MIFVNSRGQAESLSTALNEMAGEQISRAHHGSVAKDLRKEIEDGLKAGKLPAICATSSLELGIDMGAVDLVVQVSAPPSLSSGLQRIGRAGHQVGATSKGRIYAHFDLDLIACAAALPKMTEGWVEKTHFIRQPLDVLAQHIVAMVSAHPNGISTAHVLSIIKGSAPFSELDDKTFISVVEMLAGRYPSARANLSARINFDRNRDRLSPTKGSKMLAIANAGTIPDRGLYGVFVAGAKKPIRVGELDEEMVFESRVGDVFILGASSWRIEEITDDQVLVSPAPGVPGQMPFWHGNGMGRPYDFGIVIGELMEKLSRLSQSECKKYVHENHSLSQDAALALSQFAQKQNRQGVFPTHRKIVIERFKDEANDWRIVILTPFGRAVHAPWAAALREKARKRYGHPSVWNSDDGIVITLPNVEDLPDTQWFFPTYEEVEKVTKNTLTELPVFASRFREAAGRALLLPKRLAGKRTPLWLQRRRSAHLLSAVTDFNDFPIVLEVFRECLNDLFDLPALKEVLDNVASGQTTIVDQVRTEASPLASNVLFRYAGTFMYDGDAPLAEKKAQALSLDMKQLETLLGKPDFSDLLDEEIIEMLVAELKARFGDPKDGEDFDRLLRKRGALSEKEALNIPQNLIDNALKEKRAYWLSLADDKALLVAAENVADYASVLGLKAPKDLAPSLKAASSHALENVIIRYADHEGPFTLKNFIDALSLDVRPAKEKLRAQPIKQCLAQLSAQKVLTAGLFVAGNKHQWCETSFLRQAKKRSLEKAQKEIEPIDAPAYARFIADLHQIADHGGDPFSHLLRLKESAFTVEEWQKTVLPARMRDFSSQDLALLLSHGDVVWQCQRASKRKSHPERSALLSLHPVDDINPPPHAHAEPVQDRSAKRVRTYLETHGASLFRDISRDLKLSPFTVYNAMWRLIANGEISSDSFHDFERSHDRYRILARNRTRKGHDTTLSGRWWLLETSPKTLSDAEKKNAGWKLIEGILSRYGVVCRDTVQRENIPGGFSALYPTLKRLEAAGHLQRGYFVENFGAAQFTTKALADKLRCCGYLYYPNRDMIVLAATDPAQPYGAVLPWPKSGFRPMRRSGARVLLGDGQLLGYLNATKDQLFVFPEVDLTDFAEAFVEYLDRTKEKAALKRINEAEVRYNEKLHPFTEAGFKQRGSVLVYDPSIHSSDWEW